MLSATFQWHRTGEHGGVLRQPRPEMPVGKLAELLASEEFRRWAAWIRPSAASWVELCELAGYPLGTKTAAVLTGLQELAEDWTDQECYAIGEAPGPALIRQRLHQHIQGLHGQELAKAAVALKVEL